MPGSLVPPIAYTFLLNNIVIISEATKGGKCKGWYDQRLKVKTENKIQLKCFFQETTLSEDLGLKFRSHYEVLSK